MNNGILHIFASPTWGGGEQYVYDLAKKQSASGYRVSLISAPSKIIRKKVEHSENPYYVLKNKGYNLFSILFVRRVILREKITFVHVHQFKDAFIAVLAACLVAASKRPKVIITRHLVKQGKANRPYRWLYKKLDKIIFVSELAKNVFSTNIQLDNNKTVVVHNSLPERTSVAETTTFRERYKIADDDLLIGFLGRLTEIKGVELLLKAAEKLNNRKIVFLLAGSGENQYEIYLKSIIHDKQLTGRVHLVGFLENPELFVNEMDIGLLPSLVAEAFGLSMLEFMRAGKPVITSNNGAQTEFVENGRTGLLVNPTVEEITEALTSLLDDEKKRREIGENAKIVCEENFNYDRFYTRIMKEYGLIS